MEGKLNTNSLKVENKSLLCVDCGAQFLFSTGEQRYFASKYLSIPKRCPQCQQRRRDSLVPEVNHD
jgi:DNA-directed RNA polymerase subunit RPC12/RpoP